MEKRGEGKTCSFCGTGWRPEGDQRLAGGFGAQICAGCVRRFGDVFADDAEYAARRAVSPWTEMSKEQLLEFLPHIVTTSRQVDEFLHGWVEMLRERGTSWHEVGLALGVTRQAAWERFTRGRRAAAKAEGQPG